MTTSLIIFKSIFVFAAAEMLSLEFTSPARVFLPLSGRKPVAAHVGVQDAAGQYLSEAHIFSWHLIQLLPSSLRWWH